MKLSGIILLILFFTSGFFYYQFTTHAIIEKTEAKVTRVIDGDTIEIDTGQKLRLKGINTPEKKFDYSKQATELVMGLIENKTIEIESYGFDKYGRLLAYVFYKNKNINKKLLKNGLATLYYYEKDSYYKEMKEAEEFARVNGFGLWKTSSKNSCLKLIELKYKESPRRCSNDEKLILQNVCNLDLEIIYKDDATHIYEEKLKANEIYEKQFSCIWNDDGDSLYVWDDEGLLMFYRY